MIRCDSCREPLGNDSLITVTTVVEQERESFVVCSPDCLTDYVARLWARMNERKMP